MRKVARLALVAALMAVPSACSDKKKHDYPEESRQAFLQSCNLTSKGNTQFCGCMLDKFQEKYTFEQFAALEGKVNNGKPPPELDGFLQEVVAQCRK